jgi:transglutaminase-like putative cysteine protease
MTVLSVKHRTEYHYAQPVQLGEHRLMSRPRDSHDLRLLDTGLLVSPTPTTVQWIHDVFGNSIALLGFAEASANLTVESTFRAEHFPAPSLTLLLERFAEVLPFSYSAQDIIDLGRSNERQYPDPDHRIDEWARRFIDASANRNTLEILTSLTTAIKSDFVYARREEVGVQTPCETLALGSGSCRDFALLMMEAARSMGLAARFVSGYLYDEALVGSAGGLVGSGATHAWLQVYLPGAGWVEFDPTNALIGGRNLIRVAVARDASQAAPLTGSFTGAANDFVSMTVNVEVTAE